MKTVISASRRTDIPAYYLKWFMTGIRTGNLEVKNPLYRHKLTQVNLEPRNVGWIVFWSRNYAKFIKEHSFFADYNLFFHFTIISHHPLLEKTSLPVPDALSQMERLVTFYGADRIIWRYDPIVLWSDQTGLHTNFNEQEFEFLCRSISKIGVSRCYFSFVTNYKKFKTRIQKKYPDWVLQNTDVSREKIKILLKLKSIAGTYNIELYSCCNDNLIDEKIKKGACISGELLNTLAKENFVSRVKAPSRLDCGCTKAIDIGDYQDQPCFTGCIYCYANPVL